MSSKQFSKILRARARKPLLIRDLKFNQFLTKDNSFLTDWSKIIRKRSPLRYIDLKKENNSQYFHKNNLQDRKEFKLVISTISVSS